LPEEVPEHARLLDRFYIPTRHPNGWDAGNPQDYYSRRIRTMRSVVQERSYGSVKVFWLDSQEALHRLHRAAERLVADRPEVLGIYLFGSLAEGRAVPGSDADVLLLLERSHRRWLDRPLDYGAAFEGVGLPVDLFCYTREEADRTPLPRQALIGSVVLATAG
jgi:predicted nucleotidyltransferase